MKQLPSAEHLRKYLEYNPLAGTLMWRERTPDMFFGRFPENDCFFWNEKNAGNVASSHRKGHYANVVINGKSYQAHRVIWKLFNGLEPDKIDHINGDVTDNRIENLRSVTDWENNTNRKIGSNNTSGAVGVKDLGNNRWSASINAHGKRFDLGRFDTFEAACEARKKAEQILGFHENHGRKEPGKLFPRSKQKNQKQPFQRRRRRGKKHVEMNEARAELPIL